MKKITKLSLIGLLVSSPAYAVDGVSITGGSGPDADLAAISIKWDWSKKWFTEGDWSLGGYWDLDGSYWKGDGPKPEENIYGIGFTPVFRLERNPMTSLDLSPFIEAGIGVHQFSETKVTGDLQLGTRFEFGDHIGLGFKFGPEQKYELMYRIQHFSNAGITNRNPGINFNQLRFGYNF